VGLRPGSTGDVLEGCGTAALAERGARCLDQLVIVAAGVDAHRPPRQASRRNHRRRVGPNSLGEPEATSVGAAIAAPSTLALLASTFPEGTQRVRAIGLYSAVSSGGASIGLVLGGMLTDWVSWRWALFINVPIGLALVWLAPRHLPETKRRSARFDLAGAITSTFAISLLVYGFVRAASDGWGDPLTRGAFIVGLTLLAVFVAVELRAEQPITPLRLFASRERSGSYLARLLLVGGMFGMFFFLTQFLQGVRGYSPLQAGIAFLPMTIALFVMVRIVPGWSRGWAGSG
jgi:MFS family permease